MLTKKLHRKYIFPSCHPLEFIIYRLYACIYTMLIRESHVFEWRSETKFEVCDPRSFNATYVVTKKARTRFEP